MLWDSLQVATQHTNAARDFIFQPLFREKRAGRVVKTKIPGKAALQERLSLVHANGTPVSPAVTIIPTF
jgi:hypothetical protein